MNEVLPFARHLERGAVESDRLSQDNVEWLAGVIRQLLEHAHHLPRCVERNGRPSIERREVWQCSGFWGLRHELEPPSTAIEDETTTETTGDCQDEVSAAGINRDIELPSNIHVCQMGGSRGKLDVAVGPGSREMN